AGLPPFLLVYADPDLPLLPEMAEEFAKALKAKKNEVEVMKAEDRNHGDAMYRATTADDPVMKAMLAFIARHSAARGPDDSGKPYRVRERRDVAYFDGKGADFIRHKLDLFVPVGKKDFPVVVLVHGGA